MERGDKLTNVNKYSQDALTDVSMGGEGKGTEEVNQNHGNKRYTSSLQINFFMLPDRLTFCHLFTRLIIDYTWLSLFP